MEIRILKYFLAVVREGNLTKAAEQLWVTQPTLSRQLTQLEEEIGTQLLIRGKRKITLTEAGILFYKRAEEIIDLVEKTEKEVSEQDSVLNGTITICSGELEVVNTLSNLIKEFKNKYPLVEFDITTGNTDQIKEKLEHGLSDFGVMFAPNNIENYGFIRFKKKEKWGILMPINSELSEKENIEPKDLKNKSIIFPKRFSVRNEVENWIGKYMKDVLSFGICDMTGNASMLVNAGLGYFFTIEGAIKFYDDKKIIFRPLSPNIATNDTIICWKKYQVLSKTSKKFLEFLRTKNNNL